MPSLNLESKGENQQSETVLQIIAAMYGEGPHKCGVIQKYISSKYSRLEGQRGFSERSYIWATARCVEIIQVNIGRRQGAVIEQESRRQFYWWADQLMENFRYNWQKSCWLQLLPVNINCTFGSRTNAVFLFLLIFEDSFPPIPKSLPVQHSLRVVSDAECALDE